MTKIEFGWTMGTAWRVCLSCAALVQHADTEKHQVWHERVEDVLRSVEAAEALAAERRERGDG